MGFIINDLEELYRRAFGSKPYKVNELPAPAEERPFTGLPPARGQQLTATGSALTAQHRGLEIWLPVRFLDMDTRIFGSGELFLPYSVVRISGKKTVPTTAMSERQGTVKEFYSIDDYQITIKGFLIDDENRVFPEEELRDFKKLFGINRAIRLDNALTNIFLEESQRVVIMDFDIPEVEGGRRHVRPFSMRLESDTIFTLELE